MSNYKEKRPWGSFEVLYDGDDFKVKTVTVSPSHRLSLQSHEKRNETWVVAKGIAHVQKGDEIIMLNVGNTIYIPAKTKHRLTNKDIDDLVIIETQTGEYFGEDDITRYEDDYQRK